MLDVYRLLARRVGTGDADELADELKVWHDAMVRHERSIAALEGACARTEDCPHVEATDLWTRAREVFGDEAETLTFLRTRASARAMAGS